MSTEQPATFFLDEIRSNVEICKLAGACFVDVSKNFDAISHLTLPGRLPEYGISIAEGSFNMTWSSLRP